MVVSCKCYAITSPLLHSFNFFQSTCSKFWLLLCFYSTACNMMMMSLLQVLQIVQYAFGTIQVGSLKEMKIKEYCNMKTFLSLLTVLAALFKVSSNISRRRYFSVIRGTVTVSTPMPSRTVFEQSLCESVCIKIV